MKTNSTLFGNKFIVLLLTGVFILTTTEKSFSQITLALGDPGSYIYGLTGDGKIYEIKISDAKINRTIKNGSYSNPSPSSANGLAYSIFGQFYYFKRNLSENTPQFVSFNPLLNTVTVLSKPNSTDDVHTGAMTLNGLAYYTVDVKGVLHYYNVLTNTWTKITSKIVDQNGNDVDAVIRDQNAGDMAMDGSGNIWMVTSNSDNYGVYKISAPLPTTSVAQLTVTRVINPTSSTPTGNSFAGIAFNPAGEIFMATKNDNRLYLLQNASTLVYRGTFDANDAGNDLTSINFPPTSILPVTWINFHASLQNNSTVNLEWKVIEQQNKGFYIQHSADGVKWEDVHFIKSRNIPESAETYSYSYAASYWGNQYYRIKQVDIDGKESFSTVKILFFGTGNSTITLWPNPAKDILHINNEGTKTNAVAKAQLYNLSGKLCMEKQLQEGLNAVDISQLPAGAYIVKTDRPNGDSFAQKIIKQ